MSVPRLVTLTTLALAVPLLAGCAGDQSALAPAGRAAREVAWLWWAMLGFSSMVLMVVAALWIYAMRRQPREYDEGQRRRLERRWLVGGGLLLPGLSIVALLIFGIPVGQRMLPLPLAGEQPLRIEVTGHQWWWEVRYPDSGVVTANQLNLPVDRPVDLTLRSADVIHAFWVPRLGGKLDMIPGRSNVLRLQADEPGVFRGQCSEFCGTQHSHMAISVQAQPEDQFAAWIAARQQPIDPQRLKTPAAVLFADYCGACHRVAGLSEGTRAPDLSDVGSRPRLGGGVLPNEPGAIAHWLREHQRLKPGNGMPVHAALSDEQLDALAEWLEALAP